MYPAALTVAGCYVPFTDMGSAVMKMLADTRSIRIEEADKEELFEKFSTMPPYKEVPGALQKLRTAGFRLFTLTDNLPEVQTRQLGHGGIMAFFERRLVPMMRSITSHRARPTLTLRRNSELSCRSSF